MRANPIDEAEYYSYLRVTINFTGTKFSCLWKYIAHLVGNYVSNFLTQSCVHVQWNSVPMCIWKIEKTVTISMVHTIHNLSNALVGCGWRWSSRVLFRWGLRGYNESHNFELKELWGKYETHTERIVAQLVSGQWLIQGGAQGAQASLSAQYVNNPASRLNTSVLSYFWLSVRLPVMEGQWKGFDLQM